MLWDAKTLVVGDWVLMIEIAIFSKSSPKRLLWVIG